MQPCPQPVKKQSRKRKSLAIGRFSEIKKRLIVDLETNIDQHQAFIYKILAERMIEVKRRLSKGNAIVIRKNKRNCHYF